MKSQSSGKIWARLTEAYWEMASAIVTCGQPLASCQARFGAQIRSAIPMAVPAQGELTTS